MTLLKNRTVASLALLYAVALPAQTLGHSPSNYAVVSTLVSPAPAIVSATREADVEEAPSLPTDSLPNAPSYTLLETPTPLPPCPTKPATTGEPRPPCIAIDPYHRFLDTSAPVPLTPHQKAYLAFHNFRSPGNLVTITGTSAFTVLTDSHTAYGPGWSGFARASAYSFSQDATGEFFGTFLIPSLFHEDPHYHRTPGASFGHRFVHAVSRTVIAQHDDGTPMPNYAVLLTYPISAELSNLYVPGVHGNAASTAERIATGLATDPINNLITEFLPDIARHINTRAVFVQRVLNMMTAGNSMTGIAASAP